MTVCNRLSLLTRFLCLLTACGQASYTPPNLSIHLPEIMPDEWEYMGGQHINTDGEGEREWVVFYRFDLACEGDQYGCPINAAAYRADDHKPPRLEPYDLCPPDDNYLCECECSAVMEDVLSGIPGDELIIRDKCGERITRQAIFNWDEIENEYVARGNFSGHCVKIASDVVTVTQRQQDRAQLIKCHTYHPLGKQTYYKSVQGEIVDAAECEYDFCAGEPEHVTLSPYPEKVVLAFYRHYNEDETVLEYLSENGWENVERCESNRCGCTLPRREIKYVQVTDLEPEGESEAQGQQSAKASVRAHVVCKRMDDSRGGEAEVRWLLVQEGNRWKLDDVVVISITSE
jgi:hypothetical protein